MKLSQQFTKNFAEQWIADWNKKDIQAILSHYDEQVVFSSPMMLKTQFNERGTLQGKVELKKYFELALARNPALFFELHHVLVGIKSITLFYTRNQTMLAAEVMLFNDEGLIIEGLSHYPVHDIYGMIR